MKHKPGLVLALAIVASLVAAACGGDDSSDGATPDGTTATTAATATDDRCTPEHAGGELTFGAFSQPTSFDPVGASGSGSAATGGIELTAVYDRLLRWNPETGDYEPHVARSIESDASSTTWTVELRDDVLFSNGDPLTSADVIFTINRHKDPALRSVSRDMVLNIASMEAPDDHTVVFTLTEPWGSFPYVLADVPGMVLNEAVVSTTPPEQLAADPAGAGAGPFVVEQFTPGDEIRMTGRDDYWGGPVCLETLRFVRIPGGQGTYEAFQVGELGAALLREPLVIAETVADGVDGYSGLQNAGEVLILNSGARDTAPPTADPRVRRAIAHAVDPQLVDDRVNDGEGLPGSAIFSSESRFDQGLEGPKTDPAAARALLEEVKAETGWDGNLRFVCDNAPQRVELALAVTAQLEAAGFTVDLRNQGPIPDMVKAVLADVDYDLSCWGLQLEEANPWPRLYLNFHSESPNQYFGYADPAFDQALDDLKAAGDQASTDAALADLQAAWNETVPAAVLSAIPERVIWADDVHGIVPTQQTVVFLGGAYVG